MPGGRLLGRWGPASLLALGVVAGAVAAGVKSPRRGPAQETPPGGTPIVEPVPTASPTPVPLPLYLPFAPQRYDPLLPGPVPATALGFVARLTAQGRRRCEPASHVLLDRPEGTTGAKPVALLYRDRPEPELNLDLYLGDYVQVSGLSSIKPAPCPIDTWQIMAVRWIERRQLPPGPG